MNDALIQKKKEAEWFRQLAAKAYTGALSDILDEAGFRGQVVSPHTGIQPLRPDMSVMGRALTLVNKPDDSTEDPYEKAIEALDQVQPGHLIIATGDAGMEVGIFGELSATRVANAGGLGALINGFTRDGRKLLEMDFPILCKGISPVDTTGRARVAEYNVPVEIGGRRIEPGQIVFADYDGIVVIPAENEQEILRQLVERLDVEDKVREGLKSGATMQEMWDRYHVL